MAAAAALRRSRFSRGSIRLRKRLIACSPAGRRSLKIGQTAPPRKATVDGRSSRNQNRFSPSLRARPSRLRVHPCFPPETMGALRSRSRPGQLTGGWNPVSRSVGTPVEHVRLAPVASFRPSQKARCRGRGTAQFQDRFRTAGRKTSGRAGSPSSRDLFGSCPLGSITDQERCRSFRPAAPFSRTAGSASGGLMLPASSESGAAQPGPEIDPSDNFPPGIATTGPSPDATFSRLLDFGQFCPPVGCHRRRKIDTLLPRQEPSTTRPLTANEKSTRSVELLPVRLRGDVEGTESQDRSNGFHAKGKC